MSHALVSFFSFSPKTFDDSKLKTQFTSNWWWSDRRIPYHTTIPNHIAHIVQHTTIIIGITPVPHITSCLWHQVWWISPYLLKHPGNPIPLPGLDLDGPKCPNVAVLSLISRNSILDCANHHSCQYTNRNRCWLPVCLTPANRGFFLQHQKQIVSISYCQQRNSL